LNDEYKQWPRDNGADPDSANGTDPATSIMPWWTWGIIMMIGFKAIKLVVAVASTSPEAGTGRSQRDRLWRGSRLNTIYVDRQFCYQTRPTYCHRPRARRLSLDRAGKANRWPATANNWHEITSCARSFPLNRPILSLALAGE
jgi:hypothetical protein